MPGKSAVAGAVDWAAWATRWDAQQQSNNPWREERFQLMFELVQQLAGEPRSICDLACGPGSISGRALARFQSARILAVDIDPFLLAMGEGVLGDAGGRLTWLNADLRDAEWPGHAAALAPFDAVLTSTALHWLAAADLVALYERLAGLIRPGGVFVNAEHMRISPPPGRFAAEIGNLRKRLLAERGQAHETWDMWWTAARAEPAFAELLRARDQVFVDHPRHHAALTAEFHIATLRMAGFAEAVVPWRYLDNTMVCAIR